MNSENYLNNIAYSDTHYVKRKWSHSVVSDSVTTWTVAYQAPLSKEFSK